VLLQYFIKQENHDLINLNYNGTYLYIYLKIIKSKLKNKMGPGFLADSMSVYFEREISVYISSESTIDDFKSLEKRKVHL